MTGGKLKTRITIVVSLMSVFAALDVALSALPGWWISWAAIIKPLYGIMLGPVAGPCAAIIGGIIGNFIWPHTAVLAVFTWVPGILGALASGIIVKGGKSHLWMFVLIVHAVLISAFYLHPVGNTVALWALSKSIK